MLNNRNIYVYNIIWDCLGLLLDGHRFRQIRKTPVNDWGFFYCLDILNAEPESLN